MNRQLKKYLEEYILDFSLTDTESVTYDGVEFTVSLTSDIKQFNTGDLDLYRFEVDFIEAL